MNDRKATAKALLAALGAFTDQELLALTENTEKVTKFLGELADEQSRNTFVVPLSDAQLKKQYPQFEDRLPSWRKLAADTDYRGPVAWRVKQGFTMKAHALLVGPCHDQLNYMQSWNFADVPTSESIVFWVPRLAPESTSKTSEEMKTLRGELRVRYAMPEHHCSSFGSIDLLFALILAHFKRKGERVPLGDLFAASDTFRTDNESLLAAGSFAESGLYCGFWHDRSGTAAAGFFLLGVEELGQ